MFAFLFDPLYKRVEVSVISEHLILSVFIGLEIQEDLGLLIGNSRITDCQFRIANWQFRITVWQFRIADWPYDDLETTWSKSGTIHRLLLIGNSGLQIGNSGLQIGNSGLQIGNSGLQIGNSGLLISNSGLFTVN